MASATFVISFLFLFLFFFSFFFAWRAAMAAATSSARKLIELQAVFVDVLYAVFLACFFFKIAGRGGDRVVRRVFRLYMYVYISVCMCVHMCKYINMNVCMHIHTYVCMYVCTHTHTHKIYMYAVFPAVLAQAEKTD
jgi:hypothetical protein